MSINEAKERLLAREAYYKQLGDLVDLMHAFEQGWLARSQAPAPALPKLPITAIRFAVDLLESTLDDPTIADSTRKVFRRHHKALRALLPSPPQAEEKNNG